MREEELREEELREEELLRVEVEAAARLFDLLSSVCEVAESEGREGEVVVVVRLREGVVEGAAELLREVVVVEEAREEEPLREEDEEALLLLLREDEAALLLLLREDEAEVPVLLLREEELVGEVLVLEAGSLVMLRELLPAWLLPAEGLEAEVVLPMWWGCAGAGTSGRL